MPTVIELSDLDGSNGFVVEGAFFYDYSGGSVSAAGDVNGDGIDDFVIGADRAYYGAGESYVVFGSTGAFPATLDPFALDGTNGFVVSGVDFGDYSGFPVSAAGDVNGDGFDDIIIGAQWAGYLYEGESYVVFGSSTGFSANFDLSALDGSNGFSIYGEIAYDHSGVVANAGDINGDGVDDIIIGAPGEYGFGSSGATYVVFGATSGFAAGLDLSSLDGTNGFIIDGVGIGDYSGTAVAGAGDMNGDGVDDVIIGAPGAGDDFRAGETYVVFGSSSGFAATLELSSLDGTNGFTIVGANAYDLSGAAVSGAGDVNGDGLGDIIIGAFAADPDGTIRAGESYVVFGSSAGFAASLDLTALDGSNGFVVKGANIYDYSGYDVSAAGDVNGDGIGDLIVGAPGGSVVYAGESYVVFGSTGGFAASLDVASLNGPSGFAIKGAFPYDGSGSSVSGAGDVDGDGIGDLLIGAPYANFGAGATYVVYGSTALGVASPTAVADAIVANNAANAIDGLGGDDVIDCLGSADSIEGNAGNDTVRGGRGFDSLAGGSGADSLHGGAVADTLLGGDGRDMLNGATGNDNQGGGAGDDSLYGKKGADALFGGNGDDALVGGGGFDTLNGGNGNDLITAGAGGDIVVFAGGGDADTVRGFAAGAGPGDVIHLVGFGAAVDTFTEVLAAATDNGADTTIDLGGGDVLVIKGVLASQLASDDFTFG